MVKVLKPYGPWLSFEAELARLVRSLQTPGLAFSAGRQCIPGFPFDGFRADAALTDGRALLAVEVEVRQTHPDTNVGKYWLLRDHKRYEKVVLFHVYTPAYNSYGWRKTLGEFYAKKMAEDGAFEYVLLDKRTASDPTTTTLEVFEQIRSRFSSLFSGATVAN